MVVLILQGHIYEANHIPVIVVFNHTHILGDTLLTACYCQPVLTQNGQQHFQTLLQLFSQQFGFQSVLGQV